MVLFYDTAGIPIQLATPQFNYGALANVRPLSFGQNPIQISPGAQWVVPEGKPYIAQGINKAMSAIGAGITASYQQKKQDKKEQAQAVQEVARENLANRKLSADEARLIEQQRKNDLRHSEVMANIQAKSSGKGSDDIDQLSGLVKGALQGTSPSTLDQQPPPSLESETPGLRDSRRMALERRARLEGQLLSGPSGTPEMGLLDSSAPVFAVDRNAPLSIASLAPQQAAFDVNKPAALSLALPAIPTAQMQSASVGNNVSILTTATPEQKSYALGTLPRYGAPDLTLPIEPDHTESRRISALAKQPEAEQATPRQMDRVFSVSKSGKGGLYDSNVIEGFIKKFNQNNTEWKAVGAEPTKEGYNIKYINIKEDADKAAQKERSLSDNEKKAIQRATYQEGQGIVTHPSFKTYEGQNGMKSMMRAFMSGYDNIKEDPKAAGTADVDLLNIYARATSGGKVTENEFNAMIRAKNYVDKLNLIIDKPLAGALLSQRQRDQMMRTMAEIHNGQASSANSVLMQGRDKMIASGQSNETHLPKPYVDNIILKVDAAKKIARNDVIKSELLQSAKKAAVENDTDSLANIKEELQRISQESEELANRLRKEKYTLSSLLGKHEFETKRQGFVGGGVGIGFGGQEPAAEPAQ
jgi:hypothetical protein